MKARGVNDAPIPSEGRLSLWQRHRQTAILMDKRVAEIARDIGAEIPARSEVAGATAAGDEARLRGIPAVGHGVGGAQADSRPDTWSGKRLPQATEFPLERVAA